MTNEFITEFDDAVKFCEKYRTIYVYDNRDKRKNLYRFVRDCAKIDVSRIMILALDDIDEVIKKSDVGILVGFLDGQHCEITSKFTEAGFTDYFILSEIAMRKIDFKLRVLLPENFHFEISLADHCNFSCQMCDHFSQLAKPHLLDIESFERDMKRLSQLTNGKIKAISLLGGEPLLNDNILNFVKIARKYFPQGGLGIITNGIKLLKFNSEQEENFYNILKKNNCRLTVTIYPIKINHDTIVKKAEKYGIKLKMSSEVHSNTTERKISFKNTFDLSGSSPIHRALECFKFNYCRCLKRGKIYACNTPSNIDIFNEYFGKSLSVSNEDYIDIFKVNSFQEIAEFCAKPSPFCRYCDVQNSGAAFPWKRSEKSIYEYVLKEE